MRDYGDGGLRKRGNVWYVRVSINGKRVERRTDAKSRKEATAILNDLRSGAAKGTLTAESLTVRVETLYTALREDYRVSGKLVKDLPKRWKHLEPVFGRDRAREVTTPRIRQYIDLRQREKAAQATIQHELACLRRMLKLGVADGRVSNVPKFPTVKVENTRTGFMDHATFEKLRMELPEPIATMAVLGFNLGWRVGELTGLQWRQVDLTEGTVRLDRSKNGDGRLAYLPEPALVALKAWRESTAAFERENDQIVRHVFHREGTPVSSFRGTWKAACEKIGQPNFLFHDLRRCAARNYTRAGIQESVAMKAMGHRTRAIFDRYNITAEADLKDAAAKVSGLNTGASLGQVATLPPSTSQKIPSK
ncbi:MAG TPA: site-specific integrase [Candidatus Binatia bacterium]|nr:site-specific integrase [Candidatus Binatia bacterium]